MPRPDLLSVTISQSGTAPGVTSWGTASVQQATLPPFACEADAAKQERDRRLGLLAQPCGRMSLLCDDADRLDFNQRVRIRQMQDIAAEIGEACERTEVWPHVTEGG